MSIWLKGFVRQFWSDARLKFNDSTGLKELPMNWQFLTKIWRPDTVIVNGKDSYLHKITVRNFLKFDGKNLLTQDQLDFVFLFSFRIKKDF